MRAFYAKDKEETVKQAFDMANRAMCETLDKHLAALERKLDDCRAKEIASIRGERPAAAAAGGGGVGGVKRKLDK